MPGVTASFKPSKRAFKVVTGPGRPVEKSPLFADVETAMGNGTIYEAVVGSAELAEGIVKELRRAAYQIKRDVTGSGGVESRPASVKTEIVEEGGKFIVLWTAYAPVPKRVYATKSETPAAA